MYISISVRPAVEGHQEIECGSDKSQEEADHGGRYCHTWKLRPSPTDRWHDERAAGCILHQSTDVATVALQKALI